MQTRGRGSKNLKILRTSYLVVVHSIDRLAGGRRRRGFNANPSESGKSVRGIFHPNGDFILSLFSPSNSKNRTTAFLPSIQSALQKFGQHSATYPLNNWVLQPYHGKFLVLFQMLIPQFQKCVKKLPHRDIMAQFSPVLDEKPFTVAGRSALGLNSPLKPQQKCYAAVFSFL